MLPKIGDIHLWKDLKSNEKYCQACWRSSRAMQKRKHCSQLTRSFHSVNSQNKERDSTQESFFFCFTFYDQKHGESTAPISIHSIPEAVFPSKKSQQTCSNHQELGGSNACFRRLHCFKGWDSCPRQGYEFLSVKHLSDLQLFYQVVKHSLFAIQHLGWTHCTAF